MIVYIFAKNTGRVWDLKKAFPRAISWPILHLLRVPSPSFLINLIPNLYSHVQSSMFPCTIASLYFHLAETLHRRVGGESFGREGGDFIYNQPTPRVSYYWGHLWKKSQQWTRIFLTLPSLPPLLPSIWDPFERFWTVCMLGPQDPSFLQCLSTKMSFFFNWLQLGWRLSIGNWKRSFLQYVVLFRNT